MTTVQNDQTAERLRAAQLATFAELYPGVTHEVRNLLQAINCLAETLLRRPTNDDPTSRSRIKQIQQYAQLGGYLTQTFLKLAHPNNETQPGSVWEAVDDVLAFFETQEMALIVDVPDDLPAVRMPTLYLELILTNLLRNASHALRATSDPVVRIRARELEGEVKVELWNNGPPLDRHLLQHPELQLTTKAHREGVGLGLRIIRELLQQVNSELIMGNCGQGGVQFSFTLKLADAADRWSAAPEAQRATSDSPPASTQLQDSAS